VSGIVAVSALREFRMHARCMGLAMTISTLRHSFVLVSMTFDTGDSLVLGLGRQQLVISRAVTGRTQSVLGRTRILKHQRLMRLVANGTIRCTHLFGVRCMALQAGRHVAMSIGMTEITSELGMHARIGLELSILLHMTAQAFRLEFAFQDNIERLMRVMAAHALIKRIVITALVAQATLRNVLGAGRPVAGMAVKTVNLFFVCRPSRPDLLRL